MPDQAPTYTVTREDAVTWVRWENGRERTSHPTMWLVKESSVPIGYHLTRREAGAWITAQF